jgi:hypothetical protein
MKTTQLEWYTLGEKLPPTGEDVVFIVKYKGGHALMFGMYHADRKVFYVDDGNIITDGIFMWAEVKDYPL